MHVGSATNTKSSSTGASVTVVTDQPSSTGNLTGVRVEVQNEYKPTCWQWVRDAFICCQMTGPEKTIPQRVFSGLTVAGAVTAVNCATVVPTLPIGAVQGSQATAFFLGGVASGGISVCVAGGAILAMTLSTAKEPPAEGTDYGDGTCCGLSLEQLPYEDTHTESTPTPTGMFQS